MKYTYEEITTTSGAIVILRSDGAFIPMDYTNSDYQAYLATLASSNPSTPQAGA